MSNLIKIKEINQVIRTRNKHYLKENKTIETAYSILVEMHKHNIDDFNSYMKELNYHKLTELLEDRENFIQQYPKILKGNNNNKIYYILTSLLYFFIK